MHSQSKPIPPLPEASVIWLPALDQEVVGSTCPGALHPTMPGTMHPAWLSNRSFVILPSPIIDTTSRNAASPQSPRTCPRPLRRQSSNHVSFQVSCRVRRTILNVRGPDSHLTLATISNSPSAAANAALDDRSTLGHRSGWRPDRCFQHNL